MNFYSKYKSYMLYFFMYCPLGFVCPLISQYCASIGFSGTQVGVVTSLGTFGAVLGGFFWGKIYANNNRKRMVVITMFMMAGLMAIGSLYIKAFILYAITYGVLYFFQGPSHGLVDSMVIANDENFAAIRAMGAIGYAVASYIAGAYSNAHGLASIFVMHAIAYLISSMIMATEKEPPHYTEAAQEAKISELFHNKKFVKLLIAVFFSVGTTLANNTYFSYLYLEAGGDLGGVGLCFLLMAGSESIFMAIVPIINRKIKTEKLLVIGMGIAVLRFALYGIGLSKTMLVATFFLQGAMDGIILVEVVKYFGKIVEPRLASLSVSTYYALGSNLGAIVSNLLAGMILDMAGARGVYIFFAIINGMSVFLYLILGLSKVEK